MNAQKVIAGALSFLIAASTPMAVAQDAASAKLDQVLKTIDGLAQDYQVELRAELALTEVVIKSIETSQFLNEELGLDKTNLYVMVPSVLTLGLGSSVYGGRLADAIVKTMTPEKAKWFAEYKALKAGVRDAKINVATSKIVNPAEMINPDPNRLTVAESNLLKAEKAVSDHLLKRPGLTYKVGRLVRAAGRTTVFIGSIGVSVITLNETAFLVLGREEAARALVILKDYQAKLESLLNP